MGIQSFAKIFLKRTKADDISVKSKKKRGRIMKRRGMVLFALTVGICLGGLILPDAAEAASKVKIDKKHFPSKILRGNIKKFDTNKDGYLSTKERKAVKKIELVNGKHSSTTIINTAAILNLKGLEYFPQTKELRIIYYKLKNLKLDKLKNLETVYFLDCKKVDGKKSDKEYDFTKNKKLNDVSLYDIGYDVKRILVAPDNKVKKLSISPTMQMKKLDLNQFLQVEELEVTYGETVESIDLGKCTLLKKADISYNKKLTKLDFSANPNLEELTVSDNHLVSLDISKNLKLKTLNVYYNYLSELDVSQNAELQKLDCAHNLFEMLDVSMLKKLQYLDCGGSKLKELNLKRNPELEYLECQANQLETLDLSENKKIYLVDCGANPIEELDVSMLLELSILRCDYARLTSIGISKNEKLTLLEYQGNRIPSIDLTGHSEEIFGEAQVEIIQKSQLLPPVDGITETGIPIDKGHFPDYALRYEVLADFDTNRDGVLSEKESLAKQPLDLTAFYAAYRREIDCTGMKYLKGITKVKSYKGTTLLNNTFQK